MSIAASGAAPKSMAVTAVGLLTLLWGAAYAVTGGLLIFAGDSAWESLKPDDAAGGFGPLLKFLAGLMIVLGAV